MKVLVCGGRGYANRDCLFEVLDSFHKKTPITMLIQGGARGADELAKFWALERKVMSQEYPAQWSLYGKAAGSIRNAQMLNDGRPDAVIAFPGGSGTADMLRKARAFGVKNIIEVQETT